MNSSLLNTFIQSYLKREWKMNSSFFLPAFSFIHSMIDYLPSLSPFLFCINLFSYQTSLSLPILSYLSHRVPFVLFNDLHYSLDTNQFDLYCNNNIAIEKAILGSYLYILLCQVITFFYYHLGWNLYSRSIPTILTSLVFMFISFIKCNTC